ncbi:MAG: DUF5667 domain-containing protein, partial [bacterium]|nr:DUF5667 domain-containing protein [bacterium]
MFNKKTDQILDEAIHHLRHGASVSDCLKKYPEAKWLKSSLAVVERLSSIPTKTPDINEKTVWDKISLNIAVGQTAATQTSATRQQTMPGFRLALPRGLFAFVTLIAILGLLNTTAVAAQNSLPGETLYPIKRTVEKIQLTLTINEVKKTEVRIQHAENRLTEAQAIVEQNNPSDNAKTITQTIVELKDATTQVADEANENKNLLQKVVELTGKQETVLADMEGKVEGDTKKAVTEALGKAFETNTVAAQTLAGLEKDEPTTTTAAGSTTTPSELINTSSTPEVTPSEEE